MHPLRLEVRLWPRVDAEEGANPAVSRIRVGDQVVEQDDMAAIAPHCPKELFHAAADRTGLVVSKEARIDRASGDGPPPGPVGHLVPCFREVGDVFIAGYEEARVEGGKHCERIAKRHN